MFAVKSAPVPPPAAHQGDAVLLLIVAVVLLGLGVVLLLLGLRGRRAKVRLVRERSPDRVFGEMFASALAPDFREYLANSEAPAGRRLRPDEVDTLVRRVAEILFGPTAAHGAGARGMSFDDLAAGLALLESRVAELVMRVDHVEERGVTQDGVLWAVLTVFGGIVAVLAAIVTLATGVARLSG